MAAEKVVLGITQRLLNGSGKSGARHHSAVAEWLRKEWCSASGGFTARCRAPLFPKISLENC